MPSPSRQGRHGQRHGGAEEPAGSAARRQARGAARRDRSKRRREHETRKLAAAHRERVAAAGGELLGAAFKFLGELVADQSEQPAVPPRRRTCAIAWQSASKKTVQAASG